MNGFSALIIILLLSTACNKVGNIMGGNIYVNIKDSKPSVDQVKVQNDQIIVSGKNLEGVTSATVGGHQFQIESKTSDKLILNAKSLLSFLVGQTFDLIVSNANASATFPLSFELQNGQVTASKLHHMNASTGDFLQFNGTSWAPASLSTNQVYVGTYNASTDTPNLSAGVAAAGTYYIVTTSGAQDLGSGLTNFDVGDWVISDGTTWGKVAVGTNTVSNFNGRTGAVVPLSGDYSWSMLSKAAGKLTGSKLQEIADIDAAGIQDGDILQWNAVTSKWEVNAVPAPMITAGSISNTQIANGAIDSNKIVDGTIVNADISATAAIDQSKIYGLTTALTNKEPSITAGTAAQYWSGNKTWQNLNPSVIGSTLTGYSAAAGAVTAADTILSAINKLSGNISLATASQANYVLKAGDTMSGPLAMGNNKITGLADPTIATDAATKAYVDLKAGTASQWATVGSNIHYSGGNVGIGTSAPTAALNIVGDGSAADDIVVDAYSATPSAGPAIFLNRARGTPGTPSPVLAGDTLALLSFKGYDGSAWPTGAAIVSRPETDWTTTASTKNAYLAFHTLSANSGTERLRISSAGNVGIGITTPLDKLSVVGNVALTGKVRMKSDTVNYVELLAPTGLGSTLSFRLPASSGTSGQILTTDGSGNLSWSTVSGGTPADGSIGYAKLNLADGDIPLAKLAGASDATKYLKGDKSWGTFITDVLTSTFATVTPSNTAIANGDSLQTVVNKTQGQINSLASNSLNKTGTDSITGTLTINPATGALKIPSTPSGVDLTDAANVQFVQNYVGTYGQWIKNVTDIGYTAGKVGVGTTSPVAQLTVQNSLLATSGLSITPTQLMINDAPTNNTGRFSSVSVLTQPNPSSSGTTQFSGLLVDVNVPASSTANMNTARGIHSSNINNGSGNIGNQQGGQFSATTNGTGTIGSQLGGTFSANSSTGTVTNQYGVNAAANHDAGTAMTSQFGGRTAATLTNGTITSQYGLSAISTSANSSTITSQYGISATSTSANSAVITSQFGISATATSTNSSTITSQFGMLTNANHVSTSTIPEQWGNYASANNAGTGTVANGKGVYGQAFISSTGAITNAFGVHGEVWNDGSGLITNGYALYGNIQRPLGGTITNGYGLYLGNIEATNKWSVYANDPTSPSYFAGSVGIGTQAPAYKLHVNGSVAGVGAYNALSDRRYKKDFQNIPDALERILALNGFYYQWRQDEHPDMAFEKGRDMGVIAQEVEKVFPEAVSTTKQSGIKSVAYSKLIAPIIEAIKELFFKSESQKREIASLKQEVSNLQEQNELMKEAICENNPNARICRAK